MSKEHKPHRSPNAYKHPLNLLAILLCLRSTPSVPYPLIASILLSTFSKEVHKLFRTTAPKESQHLFLENGIGTWLAGYLEEAYMHAEHWGNRVWDEAVKFDAERVADVLRCVGLDGCGFEVAGNEEVRARVTWGGQGDWKAGSEPLGVPTGGFESFGWVGKEREEALRKMERVTSVEMFAESIRRPLSGSYELNGIESTSIMKGRLAGSSNAHPVPRHRRHTVPSAKPGIDCFSKEQKMHPCRKSFGEQLEIRTLEEYMTRDVYGSKPSFLDRVEVEDDSSWIEFHMLAF